MDKATLPAFEERIINACNDHEHQNFGKKGYHQDLTVSGVDGEPYFVKFGDPDDILPEVLTQDYIAEIAASAASDPRVPRVARVLHHFEHTVIGRGGNWTRMYLVMEFIQLKPPPTTPSDIAELSKRAGDAVAWLANVPVPPDHSTRHIGPVGGGLIRNGFFKDYRAPLNFSSIEAIERYLRAAFKRLKPKVTNGLKPVKIQNDRIMFTQSDMHITNFGIEQQSEKTVLMDFALIGLIPETFIAYTMNYYDYHDVITALSLPMGSNYLMNEMSGQLKMTADPTLGLNKDGCKDLHRHLRNDGPFQMVFKERPAKSSINIPSV